MRTSRPVKVQGRILGIVVNHAGEDWRFLAADPAISDIDRATFASPANAERVARLVFARSDTSRDAKRVRHP